MESSEDWRLVVDIAAFLFAIGALVYAHFRTKSQATQAELVVLRDRIAKVEGRLEQTPTVQAIHELAVSLEHLSGNLKATVARIEGLDEIIDRMDRVLNRHEEFLLKSGGNS